MDYKDRDDNRGLDNSTLAQSLFFGAVAMEVKKRKDAAARGEHVPPSWFYDNFTEGKSYPYSPRPSRLASFMDEVFGIELVGILKTLLMVLVVTLAFGAFLLAVETFLYNPPLFLVVMGIVAAGVFSLKRI